MTPPDPYTTLGLPRTASAEDVKAAFRKAALEAHPDRLGPSTPPHARAAASARFAALTAAYEVLGDGAWWCACEASLWNVCE